MGTTEQHRQVGAIVDLSDWRISRHALRQASRRLGMPMDLALVWLRSRMARARWIDSETVAERLGTKIEHLLVVERHHRRRRGAEQRHVLLADAPETVIGIVVPRDRILVTVLVKGRMLPLSLKTGRSPERRRQIEFERAAVRLELTGG